MAEDTLTTAGIGRHGATRLPSVDVDIYNIELKDDDGFLGDRASKGAFQKILHSWRKPLKNNGDDPFGEKSTGEISKSTLDEILIGDDVAAAAVVHSAIEDFARELATVTRRLGAHHAVRPEEEHQRQDHPTRPRHAPSPRGTRSMLASMRCAVPRRPRRPR